MEVRVLTAKATLQVRAAAEGKPAVLEGYAAVFHDPEDDETEYEMYSDATERVVERVMAGCFDRCMQERADVRACFNHDMGSVLGRTTAGTCRLSVDKRGLRYEVDLPDTQMARDLALSIGRGDVTGSSFSFMPRKQSRSMTEENGVRTYFRDLQDVELYDVGPATIPAYSGTTAGMRCLDVELGKSMLAEARAEKEKEAAQEAAAAEAARRSGLLRRRLELSEREV